MKTQTSVVSLTEFKARAAQMLEEMKQSDREIVLTQNGAASAVVQDYASYQRLQEALAMLKLVAQGEADVRVGSMKSQGRVFADMKKRITRDDA